MDNADSLRREFKGFGPEDAPAKSKTRRRKQYAQTQRRATPPAPAEPSVVAQEWVALGEARGMDFPFDANWLAHQIQAQVVADERMQRLRQQDRAGDVWRLVSKMVEVWWRDYTEGTEVNRKNAADYFLRVDWEDCRDYSISSLRATYLKSFGKPVELPQVDPDEVQAHQARLREVEATRRIREFARSMPEVDPVPLDSGRRQRLRSFVERHRQKGSKP